ncbi:hypothetical protein FE257_001611 [Aspergillus nanangensis]|uniref:P-loop containing nucleoside triphosphate hydrolase protein n=1 Tax=Aspergillus nanangensis TaxID=2582783 RepID=A0AAD4CVJ4_ASPNN|nr:hypothetical protein FE257_001611 [Aspergillus nanangensis]
MDYLLEWIFTVPDPPPRTRTKPMQVICVGPPRSATESLSIGLQKLGLTTFHGWDLVFDKVNYIQGWAHLLRRKWAGTTDGDVHIPAADFDVLLGHSDAVIDSAAFFFAAELIEAYPDAKVVLNTRRDLDAWHRSAMKALVGEVEDRPLFHALRRLVPESYWLFKVYYQYGFPMYFRSPVPPLLKPGLQCNGKWAYRDHCNMIRGLVAEDRLLEWSVEDGWEPLCKFLDKPCPQEPFPNTNTVADFGAKVDKELMARVIRGLINLLILTTSVGGLAAAITIGVRGRGSWNPVAWIRSYI